jgi:hypothetical protein
MNARFLDAVRSAQEAESAAVRSSASSKGQHIAHAHSSVCTYIDSTYSTDVLQHTSWHHCALAVLLLLFITIVSPHCGLLWSLSFHAYHCVLWRSNHCTDLKVNVLSPLCTRRSTSASIQWVLTLAKPLSDSSWRHWQ